MKAPETLRRPSNWQDFETLCKKLWGEIWNCPEIKKNGRNGQIQHGVDISGMPLGEDQYYGIQCKGKDEYTNKQFTEAEITEEIEKAKKFNPPLKKLYLATTAIKDTVIEEFVRKKNVENKNANFFEVHIFSWEDIVDLIDENKQTHDWYVKSQNYKSYKSVSVTFQNNLTELTIVPKFKKEVTQYIQKFIPDSIYSNLLHTTFQQQDPLSRIFKASSFLSTKINLSYSSFCLMIHNTGSDPIENFKLSFKFNGEIQDLAETNELSKIVNIYASISDITLSNDGLTGNVTPQKPILVGDDIYTSDNIFLKPFPKENEILIEWKIISRDFKDSGQLKLIVRPDIELVFEKISVEDSSLERIVEGGINDVIIDKRDLEE